MKIFSITLKLQQAETQKELSDIISNRVNSTEKIMQSNMYSTFANDYDQAIQNNIYNAHFERPSLQAMLPALEKLQILDLGCGSGVYAEYLLANGASQVTCIDYSEEMVQIVKKKAELAGLTNKVITYSQDLLLGLPNEKNESADLVISPLMIHYLEDLNLLFQDIYRVLKHKGMFLFSTHHPFADFKYTKTGNYFERELVEQEWKTFGKPIPVKFYRRSLTDITEVLTKSGFSILRITEGKVSEKAKEIDADTYKYLSENPNFIFIKCLKV